LKIALSSISNGALVCFTCVARNSVVKCQTLLRHEADRGRPKQTADGTKQIADGTKQIEDGTKQIEDHTKQIEDHTKQNKRR
ncbi:hypothetical protein T08_3828, partial [Trichinella sp. T8]